MEIGVLRKGIKRDFLILLGYLVDELSAWTFQNQMRRVMFQGWYKKSSVGPALSRLLSVGDIERIEKKREVYYRLTSRGSGRLKQSVPLLKLAEKPWDRKWRIVIFDIAETKRAQRQDLRRKLIDLGFGRWQKSVYITPHDIEQEINQYLKSTKIFPRAICLVARRSEMGDDKKLANWVWKLDKLNERYEDFIFDCERVIEAMKSNRGESIKEIRKLWVNYKELLLTDPHLPKELLPTPWLAEKARGEFSLICSNMSRSAQVSARKERDVDIQGYGP